MNEILRIGFEILHFHRLFARLDAANGGSVRLLERLGLRREAHLVQAHKFNETGLTNTSTPCCERSGVCKTPSVLGHRQAAEMGWLAD